MVGLETTSLRFSRGCGGAALLALLAAACGDNGGRAANGPAQPPEANQAQTAMPHGDHNPHHGGVVLMQGDLHYEVLIERSGHYQVYFSDARRAPLPATFVSKVEITIMRKADSPEVVALRIADDGESWIGDGKPVQDQEATARISYEIDGKGYWIDLPFNTQPS